MNVEKIRLCAPPDLLSPELHLVLLAIDRPDVSVHFEYSDGADAMIAHASQIVSGVLPDRNLILFGNPRELAAVESAPQVVATLEWPSPPSAMRKALTRAVRWLHRERQLRELANTDPLTGLLNRRGFDEQAARRMARAAYEGDASAVLLIDIDHFKRVNDTYGHAAGDTVLRRLASLLPTLVRPSDVVGRIGGEELAVVLPSVDPSEARSVAEALRAAIADVAIDIDGRQLRVTASIGVASAADAGSLTVALRHADEALYAAKASGRNKVVVSEAPPLWQVPTLAELSQPAVDAVASLFDSGRCAAA